MNLKPASQLTLYGLNDDFNELASLYNKKKLPNKILLSGNKGIGKCTLAYHLINFILSNDEEFPYDEKNFTINENNKSFKLTINNVNPNFNLIDVASDKKFIDISQIRNLILNLNKSSLNKKPRFVLIDNIEYLNKNSINSLLKFLEEPNDNIYFLLIHNNKRILSTLKSRCLNFKIHLTNSQSAEVLNCILKKKILNNINNELIDYYFTPGKILELINFSNDYEIELENLTLKNFLRILIEKNYYKKNNIGKTLLFDLIESFLQKKEFHIQSNLFEYFITKINDVKKFNLDDEIIINEFHEKVLNE
ncbi:AAA family ATPase [Candidatus Pelagibacter sp.]|nr:AAA family ATPase [Candidatus Pelagibacter sp.]